MTNIKQYFTLIASSILILSCSTKESEVPWQELIQNESLAGWIQKGGEASYNIENGIISGTTVRNTPNSFLISDKQFDDFILELDYKVDPSMNSGIQIRSNSMPSYRNGVVHGYQIEIDPSERAWSAGIYDEQRRGWLCTLDDNSEAQKTFKQNEWNHYRIEAHADTIKTWINGVSAAHLVDDKTASGFIGLQVHSINEEEKDGTTIQWKNIKIITDSISKYVQKSTLPPTTTKNKLTIDEEKQEWKLLFDGESTSGWRGAKLDGFPDKGWYVENEELIVPSTGGAESAAGGDIVTIEEYSNFELQLDFKITEGANSGIKYYVNTELNKGEGSSIGLEYQILDDLRHPDAKLGNQEGSRTLASVYDLIKANPNKPVHTIGEWNTAYIISKDNHVEHWLNGVKVLEYERKSDAYRKLVAESKYKIWPNFGEADKGHILLQDHGDKVFFKNIKIKDLGSVQN